FRFFSFTPFGLPILLLGIVYMTFARHWLTNRDDQKAEGPRPPSLLDWIEEFQLAVREYRVRVTDRSPLVGKTIEESRPRDTAGANLVAIERDQMLIQPTAKTRLRAGDILFVDLFAPNADVEALRREYALEELPLTGVYFTDRSQEI